MKSLKVFYGFLILLFIVLIILKIFGQIGTNFTELMSYLLIIGGFSLWASSFTSKNKWGIFAGSFIFLSGVFLAVESFFTIWNPSRMIFPSIFIVSGISFFFIYLSDKRKVVFLILSLILNTFGMIYLLDRINFKPNVFISAIWELILNLWFVLILIGVIIYIFISRYGERED